MTFDEWWASKDADALFPWGYKHEYELAKQIWEAAQKAMSGGK